MKTSTRDLSYGATPRKTWEQHSILRIRWHEPLLSFHQGSRSKNAKTNSDRPIRLNEFTDDKQWFCEPFGEPEDAIPLFPGENMRTSNFRLTAVLMKSGSTASPLPFKDSLHPLPGEVLRHGPFPARVGPGGLSNAPVLAPWILCRRIQSHTPRRISARGHHSKQVH
jgi:hypothetical protein